MSTSALYQSLYKYHYLGAKITKPGRLQSLPPALFGVPLRQEMRRTAWPEELFKPDEAPSLSKMHFLEIPRGNLQPFHRVGRGVISPEAWPFVSRVHLQPPEDSQRCAYEVQLRWYRPARGQEVPHPQAQDHLKGKHGFSLRRHHGILSGRRDQLPTILLVIFPYFSYISHIKSKGFAPKKRLSWPITIIASIVVPKYDQEAKTSLLAEIRQVTWLSYAVRIQRERWHSSGKVIVAPNAAVIMWKDERTVKRRSEELIAALMAWLLSALEASNTTDKTPNPRMKAEYTR